MKRHGEKIIITGLIILLLVVMVQAASAGAVGGISDYSPSISQDVDVGTTVNVSCTLRNDGVDEGFVWGVVRSVTIGDPAMFHFEMLQPNEEFEINGSFDMPNHQITLRFLAGHGFPKVEDKQIVVILTPTQSPTPTPKCSPNATRCVERHLERCSEDGMLWVYVHECFYGCSCSPEPCHCKPEPICTPNLMRCWGDDLHRCNLEGSNWDFVRTCEWWCSEGRCNPRPTTNLKPIAIAGIGVVLIGFLVYYARGKREKARGKRRR